MQSVPNRLVSNRAIRTLRKSPHKGLIPGDRQVEQLLERNRELILNFLPNTTVEQINAIIRICAQEPEAKPPPWQRSRHREDSLIAELFHEVISQ
jgi:hypothetical protein